MEVVFYIADTITAAKEPASLVFAGLKNEGEKKLIPVRGRKLPLYSKLVLTEKKLIPVRGRKLGKTN